MAKIIRGQPDQDVTQVLDRLEAYERDHPGADAQVYRQSPASIRIRIIDDRFAGMTKSARHRDAWQYIKPLAVDVQEQISLFLLLPTAELHSSFMNQEFDNPVASGL